MQKKLGRDELRAAMQECRKHFINVGFFSIWVNLLMLTGPLFMLQVYDRVLSSRSEPTLLALLILVTVLFLFMGLLDFVRGRVLSRAGAKFQSLLDERVFTAVMRRSVAPAERSRPNTGARDLDSIRQLLAGPAPFAFFDTPWVPIYLGAIFLFHPMLGWVAVAGGAILVTLSVINQYRSAKPGAESQIATQEAENLSEQLRQNAEAVQGLGMMGTGLQRWRVMRAKALDAQLLASDRTASYTAAGKSLRFYLQSFMLAAGAYYVLQGELSPGMMIAGSILMGRALAPIEQGIGQWSQMQRAMRGWKSLSEMLERTPIEAEKTRLPAPKGFVQVQNVTVVAPGERVPALRGINFELKPGQALGVIGPSGSGKTTLAKALTGIWPPMSGKVRIDGAALDQWNIDDLGKHIGYLPQEIGLLSGTVAQNIARLLPEPDDEKVIEAAQRAGAHELLLSLPQGYDTDIGASGQRLSGGQRQRVALARALYNDPPLLVLDEPNANLDAQGENALVDAIRDARARGRTVIIMAHRPSAIAACDLLLMLDKGMQVDFGPRDEVLKKRTKNFAQLTAGAKAAGAEGGEAPRGTAVPIPAAPGAASPVGATLGHLGLIGGGTGGARKDAAGKKPAAAPGADAQAAGRTPPAELLATHAMKTVEKAKTDAGATTPAAATTPAPATGAATGTPAAAAKAPASGAGAPAAPAGGSPALTASASATGGSAPVAAPHGTAPASPAPAPSASAPSASAPSAPAPSAPAPSASAPSAPASPAPASSAPAPQSSGTAGGARPAGGGDDEEVLTLGPAERADPSPAGTGDKLRPGAFEQSNRSEDQK